MKAIGDRDVGVGTGMMNMTGQLGAAAGISILGSMVTAESDASRYFGVLSLGAGVALAAVAIAAAIRFQGPVRTRDRLRCAPRAVHSCGPAPLGQGDGVWTGVWVGR